MSWCEDPLDLFKVLHWVFMDTEPPQGRADAAYLFGQDPPNESSILARGIGLYQSGKISKIALCYNLPDGGLYRSPLAPPDQAAIYRGFHSWKKWLEDRGVNSADTVPVTPPAAAPPNPPSMCGTHLEAAGLIREARERGWLTVYLVDAPYHLLRAFVSTLKEIERGYQQLKVYLSPGSPDSWIQPRPYGQVQTPYQFWIDALIEEWQRLESYYQKGDLPSCREALEYLRRRDL